MSEKWFWAWRRLKYGESANDKPMSERDWALTAALVSAVLRGQEYIPEGDGKFSRLVNYIEGVRKEAAWIKDNFTGRDEVLEAFVAGVDVTFEAVAKVAENIKKGR